MDIIIFFFNTQEVEIYNNKYTACHVANTKIHYSTSMPITTRTIAKGVPPRVHEPKGKAKAKRQAKQAKNTKPSRKRVASDSESEVNDEAEPRAKKKQNTTHHQSEESQSESELVEDNVEPPEEEVESVDGAAHGSEVPDEQEVSIG